MTRSLLSGLLLTLCLCVPVGTQAAELSPAQQTMAFADHLFTAGDYYRAITEYERLLFFYPQDELAGSAALQIARAYQMGGKWQLAVERFRTVTERYAGSALGAKALYLLGETYLQQKEYALAIDAFDEFLNRYPAADDAGTARQRRALCLLQLGDWQGAAEQFRALPVAAMPEIESRRLATATENYPHVPQKSPYLATALSAVLPGAGQLYVERPKDALTSFLLNGIFIWGAIEAFERGNNVTGAILTAFESGWYTGNLYNAANSAHKHNRRSKQNFIDNLRSEFGLACYPDAKGHPMLTMAVRF